jgi:hypothetical protein
MQLQNMAWEEAISPNCHSELPLRIATQTWPPKSGRRGLVSSALPDKNGRFPSAKSERRALRIVARSRNRPKSRRCMPKRARLQSLQRNHSAPAPVRQLVRQSALLPSACRSGWNSATDLLTPCKGAEDHSANDTEIRHARIDLFRT